MSEPPTAAVSIKGARPYGLLRLAVSTVLILLAAALFTAIAAAIAFGVLVAVVGWTAGLSYVADLDPTGGDATFVERTGTIVSLAVYAAIIVAVLAAARFRGGAYWRDLVAWRPWHPFRRSRWFWIVAGLTIVYSFVADAAVAWLYPQSKDWVHMPAGPAWAGLFVVLACVFAPLAEEIVFRGWLYTGLRVAIGVPAAVILSAILFALAHWESTHLYALAIFPVGLVLGLIRERTGSIKASATFHAIYNAMASVLLLFGH